MPTILLTSGLIKNVFAFVVPALFFPQNESVTSMKKARQQYFQRCDELEKAKAISAKTVEDAATIKTLDKRRRSKDEAQAKVTALECITLV